MKRYGPLHSSAHGLLIGDPGRRHLLLAPERLAYRDRTTVVQEWDWDGVDGVALDVPTSRFRFPGAVAGFFTAAVVAFVGDNPGIDPDDGVAVIRMDGSEVRLAVGRHHVGGYWARSVRATQRLLDRLCEDSESRGLLKSPDGLLKAVMKAARV